VSEGHRVGDSAVAGYAAGKLGSFLQAGAEHQAVDAFMHIAQPLFQAHDSLAVAGEAEVAGLYDAGMHRAHGNLMQRRADRRVKHIGIARGGGRFARAQG
jgi:hypothetical protein